MATIRKRKNQGGTVSYQVIVRLKGYPHTGGTFERLTDAREWAAKTEADMKAGRYFGAARSYYLSDLILKYKQSTATRLKSWGSVEKYLEWWEKRAGDVRLDAITAARIADWRDELLQKKKQRGVRPPIKLLSSGGSSRCFIPLSKLFWHRDDRPVDLVFGGIDGMQYKC